jgi:hypothetical protein
MCPDFSVGVANRPLFPTNPFLMLFTCSTLSPKLRATNQSWWCSAIFHLCYKLEEIYMLYVCVCSHTHYVQIIYHHCTYVYIYIYLFIYTIMSQSLDLSLVCHQCFNVFTIRSNGKVGASRQAHNAHNGHNSVVLLRSSCSHCCATLASQGDKLRSASLAVRQSPAIRHAKPSLTKHDKTQERHFSLFTWLIPKPSQWA